MQASIFPMVCASYPRYGGPFQVNIHSLDYKQMVYVLDALKSYLETEICLSFDIVMAIIIHPFRKNQDRIKAYMKFKENKNRMSFIEYFKIVKAIKFLIDFILFLLKAISDLSAVRLDSTVVHAQEKRGGFRT